VTVGLETAEVRWWRRKSENPHFIETDELWSTYGDTFGKPSGSATWPQNFVGQSSKTAEIWPWGRKSENPHFLETDELWSTYADTFGKLSSRATWPQNFVGQSSKTAEKWRWGENRKTPTFLKLGSDIKILSSAFLYIVVPYKCAKFGKDHFGNGQISKTAEIWRWGLKSKNPISRNWWTLIHICRHFWKALGKGYKPPNFLGQSSETKKLLSDQILNFGPISRKWWTLVHIFWHFWKALRQGYMTPKFCGAKFKNNRDMAMGAKKQKTPTFSKLVNFGPHISTLLESPRAGLQVTKILWAKVQKRRRYRVGGKIRKTPIISKTNFVTPMGDECDR